MRLNAFLARSGVASRRGADELIKAGRVTVNGELGQLNTVVGTRDRVEVDGRQVERQRLAYVLLHKPAGGPPAPQRVCRTDARWARAGRVARARAPRGGESQGRVSARTRPWRWTLTAHATRLPATDSPIGASGDTASTRSAPVVRSMA